MDYIVKLLCLFILAVSLLIGLPTSTVDTRADETLQKHSPSDWPLFAFDNGVGRDQGWNPLRQAQLVSKLGYAGIGYSGVKDLEERYAASQSQGIRIISFYEPFHVGAEKPVSPRTLLQLANFDGKQTILWIHLHGEGPEVEVVEALQQLADQAAEHDVRVAIYPHVDIYVETASHALRLAQKVNRENFGMSINLCHELKSGTADGLIRMVRESIDHLFLVSINGADQLEHPEKERAWSRLIQPLGAGNFDLLPLLRELRNTGYEGPIGVQCYRVPGEPEETLKQSMQGWQELVAKLDAEDE